MEGIQKNLRIILSFSILLLLVVHNVQAQSNAGRGQYKQCEPCHGAQGEGKQNLKAPAIAGLPAWYITEQLNKFKGDIRGKHPKDIAGMRMRPMAKTIQPRRMEMIASYISQLPPTTPPDTVKGDAEAGKILYAVCSACHGSDGKGNKDLSSPPLIYSNDWYHVTQLKNFQGSVRGSNPEKDINGSTMQAMANTLPDEKAIIDVVTYINTLKK